MTVNNSYGVINSAYDKLRSTYNLNDDNNLTEMLHKALENNKNVEFIEDKVTISKKKSEENQFGTDAWLEKFLEDLKKQEEANEINGIVNKLYMGLELSTEEMQILQEKAPELYKMACEARQMAKELEKKLKSCKSKDEVDRVKMNAIQNVAYRCGSTNGNNIPKGQETRASILYGTINKVFSEFMESEEYAKLPKITEEEKQREEDEKSGAEINIYI